MPRAPSPEKRRSILEAARALFLQRGFSAVSMDAVATAAKVSKRTLYKHFESKEELFGAIIAEEKQNEPSLATHPLFDPEITLEEQLRGMAEARFASLFEPARFEQIRMIIGETLRSPELAREFGAELDGYSDLLVPWLQEATKRGALKVQEPELASRLFWKGILGLGLWPALLSNEAELPADFEKLKEEWITAFLAHYRS